MTFYPRRSCGFEYDVSFFRNVGVFGFVRVSRVLCQGTSRQRPGDDFANAVGEDGSSGSEKNSVTNTRLCTCKMKVDTHKKVWVSTFCRMLYNGEREGCENMGKKGTPHRRFSKEEKLKYIKLHLEDHVPVRQIETEYGIGSSLISAWVKRYLEDGEDALEPHNGNPYAALHTSKSLSEVERLRLLVAKQEVEIARLKKGYWVEGAGANREYVTGSGKTTKFSKNSK